MDFYTVRHKWVGPKSSGHYEIYPEFSVKPSRDLMVNGKNFYAVYNEETGLWSQNEYEVAEFIDRDMRAYKEAHPDLADAWVNWASEFSSGSWVNFRKYVANMPTNMRVLDNKLTFSNTKVKKTDYVSRRLPYPLEPGEYDSFDEIVGTLYSPEERQKIEWAIGSIVSGDARTIQKFMVLYGKGGTGKGTILNIVEKLFDGYCATFDAKALTSSSNSFSTEAFRDNPLVAVQHDGSLSRIEDNTKLNSIVSHENITINVKFQPSYTARLNCFLFIGSNDPVKITDAKSGIIRRLIDVSPLGKHIPEKRYDTLMAHIDFELGAIASHCLEVYQSLGKHYYDSYKPIKMMFETDEFYNYVESCYNIFAETGRVSLTSAYELYTKYCSESNITRVLPRYKFRESLKDYFNEFYDVARIDGKTVRSVYEGFNKETFKIQAPILDEKPVPISFDYTESPFDQEFADLPAQYGVGKAGTPRSRWADCTTKLSDIDTKKLHYVKPDGVKIVMIDFDKKDESGKKNLELNLEAASKWPRTYGELSKSGEGIHLYYIWDGDPDAKFESRWDQDDEVEIKTFGGGSSIRRQLLKCNNLPITHISSGLPLKSKEVKTTVNFDSVKSEQGLRDLIVRNLNKEIADNTRTSIDFIYNDLKKAYESGLDYDVRDMRQAVLTFANNSSNQSQYCTRLVNEMPFVGASKCEEITKEIVDDSLDPALYFYDVEVFPNLFVVVYMKQGGTPVKLINPDPMEVEILCSCKLVGFNCRRYDNHIMYAWAYLHYDNERLYKLSKRIISGDQNAFIGQAYNLSYTDVYDFSSKKQSLKKFEIELGVHHQELGFDWDKPVPEDKWDLVAAYCVNDVVATAAVFEARSGDFTAREILADITGGTVNDTTNSLTQKFIFGDNRSPQNEFNYRNMGDPQMETHRVTEVEGFKCDPEWTVFQNDGKPVFPYYTYEFGKSLYRDEDPKEGGYVYAEPGMYGDVALLDIESMHPSSIIAEELFGSKYTPRFGEILEARKAIKHKDWKKTSKLLDGKLTKYVEQIQNGDITAKDLSNALKIAINSVYGLTSASFENRCHDPRNKDNIVAKRGALFMINLKHEVQSRGYTVAHIKTDSIKIPNADMEIIKFVQAYGRQYGYNFVHEATYEKMCLVNDAVYIAKYLSKSRCQELYGYVPDENEEHEKQWTATGTQFAVPYVFKMLFTKEAVEFRDLCETKSVTTNMYLDMNEDLPDVSDFEKEIQNREYNEKQKTKPEPKLKRLNPAYASLDNEQLEEQIKMGHNYVFVGKAGSFVPILPGCGGGRLVREKDGKYNSVTGAKDYRWLEAETVEELCWEDRVDLSYHNKLCDEAQAAIEEYGFFEWFASDEPYHGPMDPHIYPF